MPERFIKRDGSQPQKLLQTQSGEFRCRACGRVVDISLLNFVQEYMPKVTKELWLRNPICSSCARQLAKTHQAVQDGRL